jgi:hypothetical protein
MLREITLSDARKRLSDILRGNPGATMLKLALEMEKLLLPDGSGTDEVPAANYKEYLYGNKPFTRPRSRRSGYPQRRG